MPKHYNEAPTDVKVLLENQGVGATVIEEMMKPETPEPAPSIVNAPLHDEGGTAIPMQPTRDDIYAHYESPLDTPKVEIT